MTKETRRYILVKKVAKHGRQAVIVVPAMLKNQLKPGTLMQLTIDVLEGVEHDNQNRGMKGDE